MIKTGLKQISLTEFKKAWRSGRLIDCMNAIWVIGESVEDFNAVLMVENEESICQSIFADDFSNQTDVVTSLLMSIEEVRIRRDKDVEDRSVCLRRLAADVIWANASNLEVRAPNLDVDSYVVERLRGIDLRRTIRSRVLNANKDDRTFSYLQPVAFKDIDSVEFFINAINEMPIKGLCVVIIDNDHQLTELTKS